MRTPLPWKKLGTEPGPELIIGTARFDTLEHPQTKEPLRRVVIDAPTWVNVVALTPERRVVLVRQFRFGTERVTTEVPGGLVDPGEAPLAAARRELREETGYTSDAWSLLATIEPNPAFQSNLCLQFLAQDARRTHALELDPGEDIEVVLLDEDEVRREVLEGEINHSLVVCALARVLDLRAGS